MGLSASGIARRRRRAVLIYLLTIILPVCVLLWLGLRSYDRQREALATLTADRIATAIEARTREVAAAALRDPRHPLVEHPFEMVNGELVLPLVRAPLPPPLPAPIVAVERIENDQPEVALAAYRTLAGDPRYAAIALSRVARCLHALGRPEEMRQTWRRLAAEYPDASDPFGRPYGIVAAIQAGETNGLLERIVNDRWPLAGEHAEHFIAQLGPDRAEKYLDRFRFARELTQQFRPTRLVDDTQVQRDRVAHRPVFYRVAPGERVIGFSVNAPWLADYQRQVQSDLGLADPPARDLRLHVSAVGLVALLLSAGVVLLVRDTSREARINHLRAEFVSAVSHELKTPITLVRLYGETLLRHDTLSASERRDFYRIITRESARLGRLVDQVLAFSRLERGALTYDLKEGDLAPVVNGVLDDYRDWLEHGGFSLTRAIAAPMPTVRFDEAAVAQALVNLVDNAVKYSGDSREIAVRLRSGEQQVVIEVEDRGVGIPADQQSRIFERFYRASTGSGKGGYGLGLFMVKHVMDTHDGRVELHSQPGRGSCFRLVFPTAVS